MLFFVMGQSQARSLATSYVYIYMTLGIGIVKGGDWFKLGIWWHGPANQAFQSVGRRIRNLGPYSVSYIGSLRPKNKRI